MKLDPERLEGEAELLVISFIRDNIVISNVMRKQNYQNYQLY